MGLRSLHQTPSKWRIPSSLILSKVWIPYSLLCLCEDYCCSLLCQLIGICKRWHPFFFLDPFGSDPFKERDPFKGTSSEDFFKTTDEPNLFGSGDSFSRKPVPPVKVLADSALECKCGSFTCSAWDFFFLSLLNELLYLSALWCASSVADEWKSEPESDSVHFLDVTVFTF